MASIIVINTWRGLPFYAITLLAGLQTIPLDLYEAASIDGAGAWTRFRYITIPLLKPVPSLIRGDVFYWGQLMAAALLGSLPVAFIYSFFVDYYVAGLTAGSVKA